MNNVSAYIPRWWSNDDRHGTFSSLARHFTIVLRILNLQFVCESPSLCHQTVLQPVTKGLQSAVHDDTFSRLKYNQMNWHDCRANEPMKVKSIRNPVGHLRSKKSLQLSLICTSCMYILVLFFVCISFIHFGFYRIQRWFSQKRQDGILSIFLRTVYYTLLWNGNRGQTMEPRRLASMVGLVSVFIGGTIALNTLLDGI